MPFGDGSWAVNARLFGSLKELADGLNGSAECSADFRVGRPIGMHLEGLGRINFPKVMVKPARQPAVCGCMLAIPLGGCPFKIANTIVCPIGVFVIYNLSWFREADEGGCYEPMDTCCKDEPTIFEGNLPIALDVAMGDGSRGSADVAKVTDLECVFQVRDMDWLPNFFHVVSRRGTLDTFRM